MNRVRLVLVASCILALEPALTHAEAPAPAAPKPAAAAPAATPAPAAPSPAAATRADIKGTLGFVPAFFDELPDVALPGTWEEFKGVQMNPNTALPGKIKELIGLAVSAQIPCKYCVYAHTAFAKLNGASEEEIKEAVVMASITRHWSTVIAGMQTDLAGFKRDVASWLAYGQKIAAGQAPAPKPIEVVDAQTALQDVQQNFGSVPAFIQKFPPEGLAGAWKEERDVELNPGTALSGKHKALIGIAVAAQTPCRFCLAADTASAKAEGATDREISEALAMAAITRNLSTWLNGTNADEARFKRDIDRLVAGAKKQMAAANKPAPAAKAPRKAKGAPAAANP